MKANKTMAKKSVNTAATSGVSLGLAVQTRDLDMISTVVENAVKIVTDAAIAATGVTVTGGEASAVVSVMVAPQPSVPSVHTVHGMMPLTAIFDEDTIWAQIESEYADLVQKISRLPEEDKALNIAKMIINNDVLRHAGTTAQATVDGLI